jgi:eukaryotic translation initiation factor 2C
MIENFDKLLVERLTAYKKKNTNALPERVYVFRDGVSEGQFDTVLEEELPLMRKAFDKMYGVGKHPKLTIIICGSECYSS